MAGPVDTAAVADSCPSDDENDRRRREANAVANELHFCELQEYALELFDHVREYLAHRGSHMLDRCSFPQFVELCHEMYRNRGEQ